MVRNWKALARLIPAVVLALLAGCGSPAEPVEYLTIPGQFAEEGASRPLIVLDAFFDESHFWIRYRSAGRILSSNG